MLCNEYCHLNVPPHSCKFEKWNWHLVTLAKYQQYKSWTSGCSNQICTSWTWNIGNWMFLNCYSNHMQKVMKQIAGGSFYSFFRNSNFSCLVILANDKRHLAQQVHWIECICFSKKVTPLPGNSQPDSRMILSFPSSLLHLLQMESHMKQENFWSMYQRTKREELQ